MRALTMILLSVSLIILTSSIGAFAIDESLGLYFSFDEVDGDKISDLSGKGNHGTINGNIEIVDGKFGKAIQFKGSIQDKVIVPHDPSLNPTDGAVTIMAWIYSTGFVGEWELAVLKWQDENPAEFAYHFSLHNSRASLFVKPEAVPWLEAIGKTVLPAEEWYHVAVVADGASTMTVYLNGEEDGSANYDGTIADTSVDVCIGGKIAGALFPFHGMMDEVAIFNRALSQAEIKTLMEGIVSPVEPQGRVAVTWAAIKGEL